MPIPSKLPTYNLNVVLRETGIKADALRAWERRYGLPVPQRTSGGHRLYSQFDVETIKWLQARQAEGLRINRAVDLWRRIEESGQDPFLALPTEDIKETYTSTELISGETLEEMRESWIAACSSFDESRAENILAQAFARYSLETVCLEILSKGLSEIGSLWYAGERTVQQEHFASSLAVRKLDALYAAAPAPTHKEKILIGCPPGEDHFFSQLMLSLFLRHRGYNVVYLGANVPLTELGKTITSTQPALIVYTAQQLITAASLYDVAQFLQEHKIPLGYGGLIFNHLPGLRERIPGHFLGENLGSAVHEIERLIIQKPVLKVVEGVSAGYKNALSEFTESQSLIEAYLWEQFHSDRIMAQNLEATNKFLANNIRAGLILGDMRFLNSELGWVKTMLENQNIPGNLLPHYLASYKKALETHIPEAGLPIIHWLDQVKSEHHN